MYVGQIPSYPYIKLFPALSKTSPVDFTGVPTVYDLFLFVFQEARLEVSLSLSLPSLFNSLPLPCSHYVVSISFEVPEDVDLNALEEARREEKLKIKHEEHSHTTTTATATATKRLAYSDGFGYKSDTVPKEALIPKGEKPDKGQKERVRERERKEKSEGRQAKPTPVPKKPVWINPFGEKTEL